MKTKIYKKRLVASLVAAACTSFPAVTLHAADILEEIVVTARYRDENLQDIPDNITAFDSAKIESAGINQLQDFINLTPGVVARETFRAGVTFITVRGVTTSQQGWSPVTYIVDGVKAGALDAINQGALTDIERIEVLKGPQGALYGAGAIAGAINVVTKEPTNDSENSIRLGFGEGSDKKISGTSSGALIEDKVLYRVNAYFRDTDGLLDTTDGEDLDFEEQSSFRGRLIFNTSEDLKIDLRAAYSDITQGAVFQERIPDVASVETFNGQTMARRGIIGEENRTFTDLSMKIDWNLGFANLTSVTGYQDIEQDLFGSASWDRPPTVSIFGPVAGDSAGAGVPIDAIQDLADNFKTFTQDLRLTSNNDSDLRWVLGAELLTRESITQLGVGLLFGPLPGTETLFLNRFDERNDDFFGVYANLNYDITESLELTIAGRYDENDYDTRQFDPATGASIPTNDQSGAVVDVLTANDSKFQPKVQLSYDINDNLMIYGTWAEGFRTGFFNTGNPTAPETTENLEIGFKSTVADGRARINGAIFSIDYSDQQNTTILATPPFRTSQNIPESEINGIELDITAQIIDSLQVELGLSVLDTEIVGQGIETPSTPDMTLNIGVQHEYPLSNGLNLVSRLDYRLQGEQYLALDFPTATQPNFTPLYNIDDQTYVNLRVGIEAEDWTLTLFGKNITDERQANDVAVLGGFIRSPNKPSSFGAEFSYNF